MDLILFLLMYAVPVAAMISYAMFMGGVFYFLFVICDKKPESVIVIADSYKVRKDG